MIALDAADLVVIAGRTLGIGTDATLDQMDIAAAQDALGALDAARPPGPAHEFADQVAAATAGAELIRALLRRPPFPAHGQQVAVAAGLQFLSLNGWQADLEPPATAVVVVEALASGRLTPAAAAAWLAPRLSRARASGTVRVPWRAGVPWRVRVARRARVAGARPGSRPPVPLPAVRVPARRAVAGALLTVAVTGVTLLAAACSRGPDLPFAPVGGVSVSQPPTGTAPAPSDSAYAACMRSHGFTSPSAGDVTTIALAAGSGLASLPFRAAEVACQR